MIPWEDLDRARAPGGGELTLHQRGDEYCIRVDNVELMSSKLYGSEQRLAEVAYEALGHRPGVRVLVGGLGMGFTLRAALDGLPPQGKVTVAEISPAVVGWNRKILAELAGFPLEDPRVTVDVEDVAVVIAKRRWDAILLDVDNGPAGMTRDANDELYGSEGLELIRQNLRPGGVLCVWSVGPDRRFEERLRKAGYRCKALEVPARQGKKKGGSMHTIFMAQPRD